MPTATAPDPQVVIREAVKNVTALATLPEITTQIIKIVEDPKSSAGKLHKIIAHDPSLAARILKVVNSAFYGVPGQVGNVDRAIVLLGLNAVKNIAVAASLGQMFRGVKLGEGFSAKDLWTHCVSVAVAARQLARNLKLLDADGVFLSGLIHDVGILVELQSWPEKLQKICWTAKSTGKPFCEVERELLTVDHAALGMALTEQWRFPKNCQQVAGFHHDPAAADEEYRKLVTIVYVADTVCCQSGKGFNLTAMKQELDPVLLSNMGIDNAAIEELKATLTDNVAEAMNVFS
jgi:putative nucleotidyltransferase with HDIG domain